MNAPEKRAVNEQAVKELKTRAEILQKRIEAGEPSALKRLRTLPEHRRISDEELARVAQSIRYRDCLSIIAAELGFSSWTSAKATISGDPSATEFGTLLYPKRSAHINLWYATYEEAASVRAEIHAYLLPYKHQFVVVDRYFIESLGLDPDDPDWAAMGFDWIRPASVEARTRLYAKRIARLAKEST